MFGSIPEAQSVSRLATSSMILSSLPSTRLLRSRSFSSSLSKNSEISCVVPAAGDGGGFRWRSRAFIALFAKVARGLSRKPVGGGEASAKPPTSEVGTRSVEPNENVKPKPKETVATEKPKAEDGDGINSSDQGTNFNPQKPKGVPEAWKAEPGKKEGNTKWVNPDNPHDYVRAKPDGTVTQVRDGRAYDADGAKVDLKSPGAHGITPDRFIFRP